VSWTGGLLATSYTYKINGTTTTPSTESSGDEEPTAANEKSKTNKKAGSGSLSDKNIAPSTEISGESFEVGRSKNKSKIDYATTIEDSYDDLNKILGSDGIKRLTDDTHNLMQQQKDLAESMQAMTPLIKNIMPMAKQAQDMMKSMDGGNNGLGNIMEMAKKMSSGLQMGKKE
jgi:hypothetical protein